MMPVVIDQGEINMQSKKKWWQADTRWSEWHDSLPESTKIYLKKQAVWNDVDMVRAFLCGALFGFIVTWLVS